MVRENDFIAVFHSIHRVMKAEKILKGSKIGILLIPAPRQIGSDCGLALRFTVEDLKIVIELLTDQGLIPGDIYQYVGGKYVHKEIFP